MRKAVLRWVGLCAVVFVLLTSVRGIARADTPSLEEQALDRINTYRALAGVPPMHLNAALVKATQAHAHYYVLNGASGSIHDEVPGKPGYTATDFFERDKLFGYTSPTVNEDIGTMADPVAVVDTLMNTVSHRVPMLEPGATDFGYGQGKADDGTRAIDVLDFGTPVFHQTETPDLILWPAPSMTGAGTIYYGETPSIFPGASYPLGNPATITYRGAGAIHIVAAKSHMTDSTGATLDALIGEGTTYTTRNTIALAPKQPLHKDTTYTVTLTFSLNGGPEQTRAWSFSTGGAIAVQPPQPATALDAAPAAIRAMWQQIDGGVTAGNAGRSWLFGPDIRESLSEAYTESPGGQRTVYYFDKGRLEITHPDSASNTVTSGLLVREMIAGQVQVGDNTYLSTTPAYVPVVGDDSNNFGAPYYADLAPLASLNNDNRAPDATGSPITASLDGLALVGTVTAYSGPAVHAAYYDTVLGHNIPDVFWHYIQTLPQNWVDVLGHPLTEAYWTRPMVGGQIKDVLIQAFERRVLTYTPDAPAGWQVEGGNAGLHYLRWRYPSSPPHWNGLRYE